MKKAYKTQVDKSHYLKSTYDSKQRWTSYWYQIKEITEAKPETILEIGIGNKTVSDYLKKLGIVVTTFDFDKSLKPDVVGDVRKLPFKKNSFDLVLCAEVLEHLPFADVKIALDQIHRVTKKNVILTLPHFSLTNLYFALKLIPFIPKKELTAKIDFPTKHKFEGEHYWEIGKKNYSLAKVTKVIKSCGFVVEKCYYPVENPRHQFFILRKI